MIKSLAALVCLLALIAIASTVESGSGSTAEVRASDTEALTSVITEGNRYGMGDEVALQGWYAKSPKWRQRTCDLYQRGWKASPKVRARMKRIYRVYVPRQERDDFAAFAEARILPDC